MMGVLTASLMHELKQPITAAITDARTCMRWLSRDQPDAERAEGGDQNLSNGARAAEIIDHVRSFYKKDEQAQRGLVDERAGR